MKTYPLHIRVSFDEKERIEREAKNSNVSLSEWIRRKIVDTNTLEKRVDKIEEILSKLVGEA